MTQFSQKNQHTSAPVHQQQSHTSPQGEVSSLSSQTSKLNLSVKVPQKAASAKLDPVQLKSNPQGGAEPGQMTDADVINAITHLVKSATVHPLGSASANRELKNQRNNLENNKEQRSKAADQAAKLQQIIDQDKIQQKNTIERTNAKEGLGQAGKEAKVDIKTDKVIKQQVVKSDAAVAEHKPMESAQKAVQQFKEEHSKSQSASNANISALASRNTSLEGEKQTLSKDLVRERAEEKEKVVASSPEKERVVTIALKIDVLKAELQELLLKNTAEVRQSEARVIEIQRQLTQAASVQAHTKSETVLQEVEDDIFDSWISRDDRRRIIRKKKKLSKQQIARQAKRALRKMTPLERRKVRIKRMRTRKIRKKSRRKNRVMVFR